MTNDLVQLLDCNCDVCVPPSIKDLEESSIEDLEGEIKKLKAEINRLKSEKVSLKEPEELKKYYKNRKFDHVLVRHRMVSERWSLMSQDDMLNKYQNGDKIIGFIALSDLPTEIEVNKCTQ